MRRTILAICIGWALGCSGLTGDDWEDLPEAPSSTTAAPAAAETTSKTVTTSTKTTSTKSSSKKIGQIDLATKAGVVLRVDGTPATFDMGRGSYIADVSPGNHHMEIENIAGKIVAEAHVDVPAGKRVRWRYRTGGELTEIGTADDLVGY
jgi:hypothetical protein